MRSLDRGLDEEAVAAVRQWRFSPGLKEGVAVPVVVAVELGFSLKGMPLLTWPALFSQVDAAIEKSTWTEEVINASDLQIRFSYPAGWEAHKDSRPNSLLLVHSDNGARAVGIDRPTPSPRNLDEPLTAVQLEQSIEMLKQRAAARGNVQIVDAGQMKVADRLWIWIEAQVPTFDLSSLPMEMSVRPDGTFGSARMWAFTTTARSQIVQVGCLLLYKHGMAETEMEEQARRAGAEFAAIMERISVAPR